MRRFCLNGYRALLNRVHQFVPKERIAAPALHAVCEMDIGPESDRGSSALLCHTVASVDLNSTEICIQRTAKLLRFVGGQRLYFGSGSRFCKQPLYVAVPQCSLKLEDLLLGRSFHVCRLLDFRSRFDRRLGFATTRSRFSNCHLQLRRELRVVYIGLS
jgi:hypothetical protein